MKLRNIKLAALLVLVFACRPATHDNASETEMAGKSSADAKLVEPGYIILTKSAGMTYFKESYEDLTVKPNMKKCKVYGPIQIYVDRQRFNPNVETVQNHHKVTLLQDIPGKDGDFCTKGLTGYFYAGIAWFTAVQKTSTTSSSVTQSTNTASAATSTKKFARLNDNIDFIQCDNGVSIKPGYSGLQGNIGNYQWHGFNPCVSSSSDSQVVFSVTNGAICNDGVDSAPTASSKGTCSGNFSEIKITASGDLLINGGRPIQTPRNCYVNPEALVACTR